MKLGASFVMTFLAVSAGAALAAGGTILQIAIFDSHPPAVRPTSSPIDNLKDLSHAFWQCWSPPRLDGTIQPADLTFQVSYRRDGSLLGKPGPVAFGREVTPHEREVYWQAVAEAIERCSDLPFTDSMGGAVAGRYFRIAIGDRRTKKTEKTW